MKTWQDPQVVIRHYKMNTVNMLNNVDTKCSQRISRCYNSRVARDLSTKEWDDYVATFTPLGSFPNQPDCCHILQTSTWAELKHQFGWWTTRVAARREGRIVAGAQILFRPLPFGIGSIAYLPKGPLVDWRDLEQCRYVLSLCDEVARAGRAILLKIEPDLPETPETKAILQRLDLQASDHTIQPQSTLLVDMSATEEEIIARMKQKTRYNIRVSENKGVTVRMTTPETSAADLDVFCYLIQITGERVGFGIHTSEYYRKAYALFQDKSQAQLFIAEYQGKPLAAIMVFAFSRRAWYFYGASSNKERQRMPTYAIQWAAIRWAKARGCTTYDLWGVPDAKENELESQFTERQDGLWPVYRFKRGFGGQLTRSIGAWDRVYVPWAYKLYLRYLSRSVT